MDSFNKDDKIISNLSSSVSKVIRKKSTSEDVRPACYEPAWLNQMRHRLLNNEVNIIIYIYIYISLCF
jgi:hypothetical protein